MNVGSMAYGNGLMIGVCGWIAFGLALGPCLRYFAVLHLQVSILRDLLSNLDLLPDVSCDV